MPRAVTADPTPRELASTDPSDPELEGAIGALEPEFTTVRRGVTALRRSWLDTFDERLRRAGMVLEQSTRAGQTRLELTDSGGRQLRLSTPGVAWPALASGLPSSPLRDRLAPVSDIRALLEVGAFRSREREIRVLNADQKMVARLLIDVPAGTVHAAAPVVLTISPVRGYRPEADRIAKLLATARGVVPNERTRRELAAAADARALSAAVEPASSMHANAPASEAVATVLQGFRRTLEENVPGLVADLDSEFLHDFRVAVRRARSTVKLTGSALNDDQAAKLGVELKWLGDLTSPTRDLDVYLLGLPAMAMTLGSSRGEELEPFQHHLEHRRGVEQRRLVRGVRSKRFHALLELWREIGSGLSQRAPLEPGPTAADLAGRVIAQAHQKVLKLGSAITADSPAEDLHTLRKRCKELRYLLEIFAPLHDAAAHKQVLRVFKALQECLGGFQDSEVQADALREFATEMAAAGTASPATLLAMGELAAALRGDQQRARAAFEGTFADFAQPKNQRSMDALRPGRTKRAGGKLPAPGSRRRAAGPAGASA